jgi:flagellar biosynthesis repressor protein FlbT
MVDGSPCIDASDVSIDQGPHARAAPQKESTAMPLRIELKPFERIVIGETVIVNSGSRSSFLVDGEAPILREKDTVTAETANTPGKRLYLCVQTMYLKNDIPRYRTSYLGFVKDMLAASSGSRDLIDAINIHISGGALYKALKEIRKLMKREQELLIASA